MSASIVWTPALDAQLRELWDTKMTARVIGERIGVSRNSVLGRAHRLGFPAHPRPPPAPKKKERWTPSPRLALVPSVAVIPRHLTVVQLTYSTCRWPYGTGPYTFCGHDRRDEHTPYCAEHAAVAKRPLPVWTNGRFRAGGAASRPATPKLTKQLV